jgi:hypothetical protein
LSDLAVPYLFNPVVFEIINHIFAKLIFNAGYNSLNIAYDFQYASTSDGAGWVLPVILIHAEHASATLFHFPAPTPASTAAPDTS